MMRLRFRMLITLIRGLFFRSRINVDETSVMRLLVLLNDVDVTLVTNDRYHAYMDLGRFDFIARLGLIKTMVRKGWGPRSRLASIRNGHPLKLLQRFELHTSVVYWDDRWFWFKQEFIYKGRTTSVAYSKVGLSTKNRMVLTSKILRTVGQPTDSPPWPVAQQLEALDENLRTHQR